MSMSAARRLIARWVPIVVGWAGLISAVAPEAPVKAQDLPSRQVTLFGILATPDSSTIDPQLKTIAPELRQLLPGYGFKLLEVQSKRLTPGQSITCTKLQGFVAETGLLDPLDVNGKVQLRFALGIRVSQTPPGANPGDQAVEMQMATVVATPPNQLSFFEKPLANGARLIIGMGAR